MAYFRSIKYAYQYNISILHRDTNLIDIIDVSTVGLGRNPDIRTKNSYDQPSKLVLVKDTNHIRND